MEYELKRSKRKTLSVCISQGRVVVRAPLDMTVEHIEGFLAKKSGWISKKLADQSAKADLFSPLTDGRAALYHGVFVPISFTAHARAYLDKGVVYIPQKYSAADKRDRAVANLFKRLAGIELVDRLSEISVGLGLTYSSFALTNARTKWGSCDGNCNIRLNWRLVMLDGRIIDYVIVHELAHTVHHDHSAAFWATVQKYLPDYKTTKKRLKAFSALTTMYR